MLPKPAKEVLRGCADRRSAIAPEVISVRLLLEESLVIAVAYKPAQVVFPQVSTYPRALLALRIWSDAWRAPGAITITAT